MATDPQRSAGARLERKAMRAYLRRAMQGTSGLGASTLAQALNYVLSRQKRYDKKPGGL